MAKSKSSANSLDIFGNMQKLNGKTSPEPKNEGLTSPEPAPKYHVTFLNEADIFKEFDVEKGEKLTYPTDTPSKPSDSMFQYHFKGWDQTLDTVTEDTVIHAEYEKEALTFTVNFQLEDSIIHTETVSYGNLATAPAKIMEKEDDAQYHYTFIGWEPSLSTPITAPTTFVAAFSKSELPKEEPEKPTTETLAETSPEKTSMEDPAAKAPTDTQTTNPVSDQTAQTSTVAASSPISPAVAPASSTEYVSPEASASAQPILAETIGFQKETDEFTSSTLEKETDKITTPAKPKVGRPATKKGIAKKVNVLFTEDTMEIINIAKVFFDGNMTKYLETLIMEDYKKNKELYDTLARTKRV